jgi:hypothetical protein
MVADEEPPGDADLGPGQPDALSLAHQLDHPGGQAAELVVEALHRLADLAQNRVRIKDDPEPGDVDLGDHTRTSLGRPQPQSLAGLTECRLPK